MFKFFYYNVYEEGDPKLIVSIDWQYVEDHWRQRYMLGRPRYSPSEMERHRVNNENRCRHFRICVRICQVCFFFDIKLKRVGNVVHGRLIDEDKNVEYWNNRREKAKANK